MLKYFYDKEADVFYFSQGKPNAKDEIIEADDDVLIRMNARTKKVRGFTLLNVSQRTRRAKTSVPLPFNLVSSSLSR